SGGGPSKSHQPARLASHSNPSNEASLQLPSVPLAQSASNPTSAPGNQSQGLLPASLAQPPPQVKQRLFAYPSRPASYAAGGAVQLRSEQASQQIQNFQNYFSGVLHLAKNQYTLKPLQKGSAVVAGTILGLIAAGA